MDKNEVVGVIAEKKTYTSTHLKLLQRFALTLNTIHFGSSC